MGLERKIRGHRDVDAMVVGRETVLPGCAGLRPAIPMDDVMLRAALYARYSSDQQNAASIADQLNLCRERAAREGWQIVATYQDAAISGASMILRPGVQNLLADAQAGRFDVVLAEALDRVSRDQADVATLYKHLQFARVPLVTLAEGEISELHVGLKGTMNALFLKDLAKKTHRGLRGRVEKGFSAGAVGYGYRMVRRLSSEGELVRGERAIDPAEALVIERIFREFAEPMPSWLAIVMAVSAIIAAAPAPTAGRSAAWSLSVARSRASSSGWYLRTRSRRRLPPMPRISTARTASGASRPTRSRWRRSSARSRVSSPRSRMDYTSPP